MSNSKDVPANSTTDDFAGIGEGGNMRIFHLELSDYVSSVCSDETEENKKDDAASSESVSKP